jgi:molecular chaperone GrpE (heat shock protein)
MHKKIGFLILGLVLLAVGIAALRWVLAEQRKEQQEMQEQQEMLEAHLDKVDDVVTGETDVNALSGIAGGEKWREEADKTETPKETRELVLTISIVCVLAGGSIFGWWLLQSIARLVVRVWSGLKRILVDFLSRPKKAKDERDTEDEQKAAVEEPVREKKLSKVLKESGWRNFGTNSKGKYDGDIKDEERHWGKGSSKSADGDCQDKEALGTKKIGVMLSDEKSAGIEEPLRVVPEGLNLNLDERGLRHLAQDVHKIILPDSYERNRRLEDKLKAQADNLEKQVAEFRHMTQTVQKTALEHSEPLNDTLRELTEQVSAIREYATQQQDRVKKLQAGYDWNIIRNFCLRVIRCIDNLESRINQLSEDGEETMYLEEAKDELIFALESSGVEQFKPEINSDYRGQEKFAEAVKDKECSNGAKMTGKIAKVLRPGYQHIIDDENVRVVRPAQVKLYD